MSTKTSVADGKATMKESPSNMKIIPVGDEYADEIKSILKEFYSGEPVFKAQRIDVEKLDESFFKSVRDRFTVVAVDATNDECVASVAINSIIKPDNAARQKKNAERYEKDNVDVYNALRFWASIQSDPCLFQTFDVDAMWEIKTLATARRYRNLGLSTAVAKRSFEEALLDKDVSIVRMDCTNYLSTKIARNLGMECVVKKHFSQYTDDSGRPWIKNVPEEPDGTVHVFIYKKSNYENKP